MKLLLQVCFVFCVLLSLSAGAAEKTVRNRSVAGPLGYYGAGCSPYLSRVNAPVLPYFSLHPPVYYSNPVPRPYGFSPFALPPGVQPAEFSALPEPEMIINPYYEPAEEGGPEAGAAAASGQIAGEAPARATVTRIVKSRVGR